MADYYVRPDGNDSNTGLGPTYSQAWKTLSKAVSASGAPKGSTIYFAPGFYSMKVSYILNGGSGTTSIIGDPLCSKFIDIEPGYVYWHCFGYYSDYFNLTSFDQNGGNARPDSIDNWYFSNIRFINDPAGGQAFGFINCSDILIEKCYFESTGGFGFEVTTKQNGATNLVARNSVFTAPVYVYMSEPTTADLDCNIKFENCNMSNIDLSRGTTGTFKQYGVRIYNCTVNQVQNLNYSGYTTANAIYIYNCNIHASLRANAAGQIINDYNRHFAYASLSNVTAGANSYFDNNRRPTGYDAGASWLWGFKPKPYHSPVPAYFTNALVPSDGTFPSYQNIRAMYQIYVTARVGGNIRFLDWDGSTKTITVTSEQKYYLTSEKIKQIYNTGTTAQLIRLYLRPPSDNYGTTSGAPLRDMNDISWDINPSAGPQSNYTYSYAPSYTPTSTFNKAINIKAGTTSYSEYVQLNVTGLSASTPGISASYVRSGAARVGITLVSQTVSGVWTSGGFVEVDAVNMPGLYRIDIPDAAFASGVNQVTLMIKGYNNTNGALVTYQFTQELMQVDMTQTYPNTNTAGTVGDALNAARAGAFGRRSIRDKSIIYYSPNEIDMVKILYLDSASAPKSKMEIQTDNVFGLIFHLDAASSTSYPGTGTTWLDISGFGNHGTLTNGPTIGGTGTGKYFFFDGTNDFVDFGAYTPEADTISLWYYHNSNNGAIAAVGVDAYNYGTWSWSLISGSGGANNYGVFSGNNEWIVNNTWVNVVMVRSNPTQIFVNGIWRSTYPTGNLSNPYPGLKLMSSGSTKPSGRLAVVKIWNIRLNEAQILQEFNTYKSRYGL